MATSYLIHTSEIERAHQLTEQLQQALDSRIVLEQAKGLLAGEMGIKVDAAFELLRKYARNRNAKLAVVVDAWTDWASGSRSTGNTTEIPLRPIRTSPHRIGGHARRGDDVLGARS